MEERTGQMIALCDSAIHLWLAFYDQITDARLLEQYRELLTEAERMQETRYFFAHDRKRYLVTRALTRTVLSKYSSVRPHDWLFVNDRYGRPLVANAEANSLAFNISHTKGLIALAVTNGGAIGVDVENLQAREGSLEIADRFFSPSETAILRETSHECLQYRFFEYWTFKEAYIKARGMGLSLPLDKFSFHYPDDRTVGIEIDPQLGDHPERWQFRQFQPDKGYVLALCAERRVPGGPKLVVIQTVPMVSQMRVSAEILRRSREITTH